MNGLFHDGWIHLGLLTIPKGVLLTPKTGCSNGLNSKARDHRDPCSAGKGRWTHHGGGLRHNHASQHTKNRLTDRPEFRSWWEEIVYWELTMLLWWCIYDIRVYIYDANSDLTKVTTYVNMSNAVQETSKEDTTQVTRKYQLYLPTLCYY